jgi:hypothetical protein
MDRLWHPPDVLPGATAGAETLEKCMPGEDKSYVLTDADLGIEILDKAERANAFPLGVPWESSFIPDLYLDELRDSVDRLQPGDRILIDAAALNAFAYYENNPDRDPLTDPLNDPKLVPSGLAPLQEWLVKEIGEGYALRPVCGPRDGSSPLVVEIARAR